LDADEGYSILPGKLFPVPRRNSFRDYFGNIIADHITAVRIPRYAAGTITVEIVFHLLAPSAIAASRSARGTAAKIPPCCAA